MIASTLVAMTPDGKKAVEPARGRANIDASVTGQYGSNLVEKDSQPSRWSASDAIWIPSQLVSITVATMPRTTSSVIVGGSDGGGGGKWGDGEPWRNAVVGDALGVDVLDAARAMRGAARELAVTSKVAWARRE